MRLPDDIGIDDASQWLGGCWYYVESNLARWRGIDDRGEREIVSIIGEDATIVQHGLAGVTIVWPQTGAINIPDVGALYVQRRPARQWRRAYSARCLRCSVPDCWEVGKTEKGGMLLSFCANDYQVVKALMEPTYPSLQEAMELIETLPSVALNRHVMLINTGGIVKVYYKMDRVGRISKLGQYFSEVNGRVARRMDKLLGGIL